LPAFLISVLKHSEKPNQDLTQRIIMRLGISEIAPTGS
jgi:hypothetical protein